MCVDHQNQVKETNNLRNTYAGSEACANCHKNIYESHIRTAHFLTSQPASAKTIKGKFEIGKNQFVFDESNSIFNENRDSGFYQVHYINGKEKKARRFDISVGSGTKGQTYLYWWKDTLFQLPLTYFTATDQWCNSPGYPGRVSFGRPVTARCLECHTTYAYSTAVANAQFEKFDHNILYGVDCEKCHGAAAQHVQFQTQNPGIKTAKYIINPAKFSRKQNLDLCILCHGGRLQKIREPFSYQSGDSLSNYFKADTTTKNAADIDVHGNQYGLLAASKCFQNSQMTCESCHNPHANDAGQKALYSQRCLSCHNEHAQPICKMTARIGTVISENCIDCHMPLQPSKAIAVLFQGQNTATSATMRTHFIKIYPEETKKMLAFINNSRHNSKPINVK
jgi:hypothetical protein